METFWYWLTQVHMEKCPFKWTARLEQTDDNTVKYRSRLERQEIDLEHIQ